MVAVVLVGGTWSWRGTSDGQWYAPDSALVVSTLRARGIAPLLDTQGGPFVWASGVGGWRFWRTWGGQNDMAGWQAGALALRWYIGAVAGVTSRLAGPRTCVICHSHGLQPVLIAAAQGLRIQTLIEVSAPVREDIIRTYGAAARANIRHWISIQHAGCDWWRTLGGLGDGRLGVRAQHPLVTVGGRGEHWAIQGIGHRGLLDHPDRWPQVWNAVAEIMRASDGEA